MDGLKVDGFLMLLFPCALLILHDSLRLLVSTQSPEALALEVPMLVSLCAMHRFYTRDWLLYYEKKIYLPAEKFTTVS